MIFLLDEASQVLDEIEDYSADSDSSFELAD